MTGVEKEHARLKEAYPDVWDATKPSRPIANPGPALDQAERTVMDAVCARCDHRSCSMRGAGPCTFPGCQCVGYVASGSQSAARKSETPALSSIPATSVPITTRPAIFRQTHSNCSRCNEQGAHDCGACQTCRWQEAHGLEE